MKTRSMKAFILLLMLAPLAAQVDVHLLYFVARSGSDWATPIPGILLDRKPAIEPWLKPPDKMDSYKSLDEIARQRGLGFPKAESAKVRNADAIVLPNFATQALVIYEGTFMDMAFVNRRFVEKRASFSKFRKKVLFQPHNFDCITTLACLRRKNP